jgi:DNA polymerase-1
MSKLIAIDVETTGLNPRRDKLHGCGVATEDGSHYIRSNDIPFGDNHLVGHNVRFDLKFLQIKPEQQIWDTKLLAQLIDENQELGLKALTKKYFGDESLLAKQRLDEILEQEKLKNIADLCQRDLDEGGFTSIIADYCEEDCVNTLKLVHHLSKKLKDLDIKMKDWGFKKSILDYYLEEAMPLEKVLLAMETRGIKLNVERLQKFKRNLLKENEVYRTELEELCKEKLDEINEKLYQVELAKRKTDKGKAKVKLLDRFNWKSGDHIGSLFYDYFKVPKKLVVKTKTGKYNTAEKQLKALQVATHDDRLKSVLDLYLKWKKNLKLLTTYTGEQKGLLAHLENGRVYSDYLQTGRGKEGKTGGTVTGRLSSRSPNMQNLPRDSEVRSFFIPDSKRDVFIYFDYSQLELRIAAHLSNDEKLIEAYTNNLDLHQITADQLGVDRQLGKKLNFALIYNASPFRLMSELGTEDEEMCRQFKNDFFALYSGYRKHLNRLWKFMTTHGLMVSETGRIRRLPALLHEQEKSKPWRHAINQGYNFPIQSLGASITKRAMIALHNEGYNIVTQVHDSVVIQASKKSARGLAENIKQIAENIYPLKVPLKVDIKFLNSLDERDIWEETHESKTESKYQELKIVS